MNTQMDDFSRFLSGKAQGFGDQAGMEAGVDHTQVSS